MSMYLGTHEMRSIQLYDLYIGICELSAMNIILFSLGK